MNHYLNSVMAPMKTFFKEGVLLVEEVKAPKTIGTVEERLDDVEQKTFRYNTVVERSLDAHLFMNLELEKKVEEYKERLKDLEDRYLHVISELNRYQSLMWDVENQNYEYEECFKKMQKLPPSGITIHLHPSTMGSLSHGLSKFLKTCVGCKKAPPHPLTSKCCTEVGLSDRAECLIK